MPWIATNPESIRARLMIVLFLAAGSPGCQLAQNPFRDELAGALPVATPSVSGVEEAAVAPAYRTRPFIDREATMADGAVLHVPLFFEDEWDVVAAADGRFAWEASDWARWPSWHVRFLINLAAFPVSCVSTPPWAVMASDGRPGSRCVLGQTYDAELQ